MNFHPNLLADDPHDQALAADVRPPAWVNPVPSGRYNLVVIGAGPAGLVCAAGAAGLGARVALVERAFMGGDCLNAGCVPSKGMVRAARALADVRNGGRFGVRADRADCDFAAVMERIRRLRAGIGRHDTARRFRDELGVEVFFGQARFAGRDCVEVEGRQLLFHRAAICTGTRAAIPPIPGLAEARPFTNETVFTLSRLPPRLAVIGGGPVGCELAQAFARFGSRVTLIHRGARILEREDTDAAVLLQTVLVREGIDLRLNSAVARVSSRDGTHLLYLAGADEAPLIEADAVLVATGRVPNLEGLGLEAVGIASTEAGVRVDDRLRTANPRVYAAGDICSPCKFTHAADAQARILLANALFKGRRKVSRLVVPRCTYTDPEIAQVGINGQEAQARNIAATTLTVELADVDRAVLDGETEGFVRVHLRKNSGTILGATLVGRHAGETIGELSLAITAGLGIDAIGRTIHPYPTQAEAIRKLADAYNRTRLTRPVQTLLAGWLRWQRR
ncbi:mercuric reductase [Desulfobulbus sp.]|uniref:mercuric reductase n=1 Tax=Desulfobulbus sp. TaxID=895 RepID=UPI00286EC282|nr:mercuric reductase [Desulfobulbus sp.]